MSIPKFFRGQRPRYRYFVNFFLIFWRWLLNDQLTGKMAAFVEALLSKLTYEDVETNLEGCIGCGNCGLSCAWYFMLQKPAYHPKSKSDMLRKVYVRFLTFHGIVLGRLGLIETPDEKYLEAMAEVAFGCCTMCGRCSLACMQGVNNRRITSLMRQCLTAAEMAPPLIKDIRKNADEHQHSFGLDFDSSVGKIITTARNKGIEVVIDKPGAKWLAACSAIVNTKLPEVAAEVFRILNAGIDYTLSSRIHDTGTEAFTTVSDIELGRRFVRELAEEAVRLGCQGIIVGECGCDMRIYNIDAADILLEYGLKVACMHPVTQESGNLRRQVSKIKACQVQLTGADTVATPCATCYMSLKDTMSCHGVACRATMVADVVLAAMDAAKGGTN